MTLKNATPLSGVCLITSTFNPPSQMVSAFVMQQTIYHRTSALEQKNDFGISWNSQP